MTTGNGEAMVSAVLSWWRGLFPSDAGESGRDAAPRASGDWRGNAAARARLRRCQSLTDALMEPETHVLLRRAGGSQGARMDQRLAMLAMILPSLEPRRSKRRFARVLGEKEGGGYPNREQGERPRLSASRFGALMRALDDDSGPDRAVRALRRALPLLGDTAFDVGAFVRDILFMSDETLRRWTYEYWQTDRRPPATDGEPQQDLEPEGVQ